MAPLKVLLFGGSGQVGGALLTHLATAFPQTKLTLFLRTKILDQAIHALRSNITIYHGDFTTSLPQIEDLVSQHDITINAATSRDTSLTQAILNGALKYKSTTKRNAIILHLSGAGNFSDNSELGIFAQPAQPFNDTNPEHVAAIDAHMKPNGACDKLILDAAAQGLINAYFVSPGGTFGTSDLHIARKAVDEGITEAKRYADARGVWFGWMLSNISDLGFSPYVGPGTSVFPVVHVDDVVDLVVKVTKKGIELGQSYEAKDAYKHYYLGVSEFLPLKELATMFAGAAHRMRLTQSADVKSVPYDQVGSAGQYTTGKVSGEASLGKSSRNRYLAGNIIVKAENAKTLGWRPQGPSLRTVLDKCQ